MSGVIHSSDGRWTLRLDRLTETVTTSHPVLDPEWRSECVCGVEHRGDRLWDTVQAVPDGDWWCDDCEDTHTDQRTCCRYCSATVTPGTRMDEPRQIVTGVDYRLEVKIAGVELEVCLSHDTCRELTRVLMSNTDEQARYDACVLALAHSPREAVSAVRTAF